MANIAVGGNAAINRDAVTYYGYTHIDLDNPISETCKLVELQVYHNSSSGYYPSCKLIIFRDDGTNYNVVGSYNLPTSFDVGLQSYVIDIDVQAGDLVGFLSTGNGGRIDKSSSGAVNGSVYKSGDQSGGGGLKSSWTADTGGILSIQVFKAPAGPETIEGDFTVDSHLLLSPEDTFTIDSYLYGESQDDFSIDSILYKLIDDNFTMDSYLAKGFPIDSVLKKVMEGNFTIDSVLMTTEDDNFSVDSYLAYPDNSRHKVTFSWNTNTISVDTTVDGARLLTRKARIARVFLYIENKGITGTTKIDVNKNGTTIFTDQSNRPSIASGGSINITEVIPDIQNLDMNDRLTIDIDEAATSASNLSIVIEINTPTSYTHELRKVELLDNGILMSKNTNGFLTSTLQLGLVFDEPLDTSVEPTVVWNKNTMAANPSIPAGGIFSSTYEKNDTYTTPAINVLDSDNYEGSADIVIKDAKNIFGQTLNSFAFSIELFDNVIVDFRDAYTNQATNTLRLQSETITRFRYSFDNLTWSSWNDFISEKDIDITDAGIGGDAVEELKTLYVQLEDLNGNSGTKTATIYYKTTVGEVQNLKSQPAHRNDYYFITWNLPTDANIVPIAKFEILIGGTKHSEMTKIYPLYRDGLVMTYALDDVTRKITYSLTSGNIYDKDGIAQSVNAGDVITDYLTQEDRFDIVGVNENGELAVINGNEGLSATKVFWEKDRGLANLFSPIMPEIPEGFLPLWIVHVRVIVEGQETPIYMSTITDILVLDNRVTVVFDTIKIIRGATAQTIRVRTTSESGAQSNTDLTFASNPLQGPTYQELRAWSETAAAGDRVYNGEIVQQSDLTDNKIYLQFIEEG